MKLSVSLWEEGIAQDTLCSQGQDEQENLETNFSKTIGVSSTTKEDLPMLLTLDTIWDAHITR